MGLHNKFPSYFYKRGNLFNTYLGHTEKPDAPLPKKQSSKSPPSRKPRARSSTGVNTDVSRSEQVAAERLGAFTERYMSDDEALRFLDLIAADCNVSLPPTKAKWAVHKRISHFAATHLDEKQTLRFLRVLEKRQQTGQRLVQR